MPKAHLQKFVTDELKVTAEAVKYENPSNNPFSYKKQTLLESFTKTLNDPPYKHTSQTKLELQIEYARRTGIERLSYTTAKKARKTKH